mgnify:CR=1 FL=1
MALVGGTADGEALGGLRNDLDGLRLRVEGLEDRLALVTASLDGLIREVAVLAEQPQLIASLRLELQRVKAVIEKRR